MAEKGKTDNVGKSETDSQKKDFKGSGVEGQKGSSENEPSLEMEVLKRSLGKLLGKQFGDDATPEQIAGEVSAALKAKDKEIAELKKSGGKKAPEPTSITCETVIKDLKKRGTQI